MATETVTASDAKGAPEIEVRAARPEDDAARDALVEELDGGTFFHLSGWTRLVERAHGHPRRDLLAFQGGELTGVLPLSQCRRPFGGSHLLSVPYGVYGGPVARDQATLGALVREARLLGEREGVGRVELRCVEDLGLDLATSDLYATFVQPLPDTPEGVMAGMKKRARAEVRKARERYGLELACGPWYVEDLVRLFNRSKRNLGSPGLPSRWFTGLVDEFGDRVAVHIAARGTDVMAAMMSFLWGDTISIYYIGVADDANRECSATNFLTTAVAEWAVERGLRNYDWGRSRKDSGAFQFKKNQGADPTDLHYQYQLVRSQDLPSFNPSNPKTHMLQAAWKRLPHWMCERLSGPLSRYLP